MRNWCINQQDLSCGKDHEAKQFSEQFARQFFQRRQRRVIAVPAFPIIQLLLKLFLFPFVLVGPVLPLISFTILSLLVCLGVGNSGKEYTASLFALVKCKLE